MNVGIYTRWQRRDSTYAAVQLADLLSRWQHDVTILTPTPKTPPVSSFWDTRVRHDNQVRFTEWAEPLAAVVWMFCPHPGQPTWAGRAGKLTVLVPDWADLAALEWAGPSFAKILAPTRRWASLLESRGAGNVTHCPWSPLLPITRREHDGTVSVYVPPSDRPDDDGGLSVDVVEAVLSLDRTATATVSTDGRKGALARRLDRLARAQPRLVLDRPADYHRQVFRYGGHSLTLLSAAVENFAMSALCSFHMGTPVVGFNVPSLAEVATPRNSVLVDHAADRRGLLEAVMALAGRPGLPRLFSGCPDGLERRRAEFEAAWSDAIGHATEQRR